MSEPSGPGSRVPIPRGRRRFDRRRAWWRGLAAFLGVVVAIAAFGWATRGGEDGASTGPCGETIVPGETPIEHVVFIVKENRTFNNYFATYPGAVGATEGGTIRCTPDGCHDGPVVRLTKGPDIYPHDLTHCFRCGLIAINGGKMNGFNRMNGPIPPSGIADLYGADMSGYSYLDRDGVPNYWAYADRFVLADHFFTPMYGPTLPEHLYAVAAQ